MEFKLKSLGQDSEGDNKPEESLEEKMKRAEREAAAAEAQSAESEEASEAVEETPVVEESSQASQPVEEKVPESPTPELIVEKKPEAPKTTPPEPALKKSSTLKLADQSMSTKKPDFTEERCEKCGTQLREGAVICTNCGTKLNSGKQIKGAGQKSSKGGLIFLIIIIIAVAVGAKLGGFI